MKLHMKKLNQRGFDHVVGLAIFVVIFAGIGTYLVVGSHAATPSSEGNNTAWTLTGKTKNEYDRSGATFTFSSSIYNEGPHASGRFQYGPRYFYSSTSNPVRGSNGAYAGELETTANPNKTASSLKSGGSITNIYQSTNIPKNEKSTYICGTVAFSPYNYRGAANGRSKAVCFKVALSPSAPVGGGK